MTLSKNASFINKCSIYKTRIPYLECESFFTQSYFRNFSEDSFGQVETIDVAKWK